MLALVCASHSPLMFKGPAAPGDAAAIKDGLGRLAGFIRAFDPELVIQFAPDHLNGFLYDLVPAFCLGVAATAIGDWGTPAGALDVPAEWAGALAAQLLDDGIDVAVSHRMRVDHGFAQLWGETGIDLAAYPIIPIFVNAAVAPLPRYDRAAALGRSVGRFARASGRRVLLCGSGGLSHDPPLPRLEAAPDEVRRRLLGLEPPTDAARQAREARVLAAGLAAVEGAGPPLNPDWDEDVLAALREGRLADLGALETTAVARDAGTGANELLAWLAAYEALATAGSYTTDIEVYRAIPGWLTGMAMTAATPSRKEP